MSVTEDQGKDKRKLIKKSLDEILNLGKIHSIKNFSE